jgi:hypothetical protein
MYESKLRGRRGQRNVGFKKLFEKLMQVSLIDDVFSRCTLILKETMRYFLNFWRVGLRFIEAGRARRQAPCSDHDSAFLCIGLNLLVGIRRNSFDSGKNQDGMAQC